MIVWESGVDEGAYRVVVERAGGYAAQLVVTRTRDSATLLRRDVTLSYDAAFGPDAADVADWQQWALEVIDADMRGDLS